MSQDEMSGQSQSGDSLYPLEGKGKLTTLNPRSFKSPREVVRLCKYLASKWYFVGELDQREILTFTEGFLILETQKSKQFLKLYRRLIESFALIIGLQEQGDNGRNQFWFEGEISQLLPPNQSGYHSERIFWSSRLSKVRRVWKRVVPKPFIGRGYTDKGNRRDTAQVGSPGWGEVAMDRTAEKRRWSRLNWINLHQQDKLKAQRDFESRVSCSPGFLEFWENQYEDFEFLVSIPL